MERTIFDFFSDSDVLEFKSTNDPLDKESFHTQVGRVEFWASKNPEFGIERVLNVIVSASFPREFFNYSAARGCVFRPTEGRERLWRARYGWQDIAVVICERLPIEPRYADWLLFAPPITETWHQTLRMLAAQHNWELLTEALNINPKEFERMSTEIENLYDEMSPKERGRIMQEWFEVIQKKVTEYRKNDPAKAAAILNEYPASERLSGLKPEERIGDLDEAGQEELLKLLQKRLKKSR